MENRSTKPTSVSRRGFLKMLGGVGLAGIAANIAGCSTDPAGGKGWMPQQYQVASSWPIQVKGRVPIDPNNPSIVRDDKKCILCGQCIEACEKVQTVMGYYELPIKDDITCVNCGQCTLWCPTGAITERDDIDKVLKAINDKNLHVVVQTAPATRVALGEEFGMPAGSIVEGKQVAALKKLGFDAVFDTNFTADLTIMEEGTELVKRITGELKKPLPQFTSCSPGWVKFCEYFYPDLLEHMSSAKSPQQMMGAVVKSYYAKQKGIDPEKIFSVSIMPCTAKKYECQRPEMNDAGQKAGKPNIRDVDVVLTTRELARMIKRAGINFNELEDAQYDSMLGEGTGAAVIFGTTGGVMEAAVRSAYFLITKQNPPEALLELTPVRGLNGVKEASLEIPGAGKINVAVCSGLGNARKILDQVREDIKQGLPPRYHFIEFMSCPGGCIGGGGQPRTALPPSDAVRQARLASLYTMDAKIYKKRLSHENQEVIQIYQNYFEHPMSELAEELLHTEYTDRGKHLTAKKKA
ncbi:[FeFe] hydrogenase, group A [Desulfotomaculum nigrificans]|uniref:[FeFe] hydrogenase, group A n=1 Tax=Desulfotomaculum nigrificans TaxID=1565 RepID=UPI0001FADF25|nr:[FeFe] hydrogenase, group A [Desulfotomaculum nigrificans]